MRARRLFRYAVVGVELESGSLVTIRHDRTRGTYFATDKWHRTDEYGLLITPLMPLDLAAGRDFDGLDEVEAGVYTILYQTLTARKWMSTVDRTILRYVRRGWMKERSNLRRTLSGDLATLASVGHEA